MRFAAWSSVPTADDPVSCGLLRPAMDGLVKIWDAQTGRVSAEFSGHEEFSGIRGVVFCVAWHPEGQSHRLGGTGKRYRPGLGRADRTRSLHRFRPDWKIALPYHAVAFSPDGRYLVTGKVEGHRASLGC